MEIDEFIINALIRGTEIRKGFNLPAFKFKLQINAFMLVFRYLQWKFSKW